MKRKVVGSFILVVLLLFSISACGSNQGSSSAETTLSPEEQKALTDKLAADATEVPQPATVPSTVETPASGETSAESTVTQAGAANADPLLGEWLDATNDGRTAKITRNGDTFLYEDNEGKYPGTFKDGVLTLEISDQENDTAKVFIDAKTQHLVMDYQGDIYEFNRK